MADLTILLAQLLRGAIGLLQLLILIHVVLSWVAVGLPLNPLTRLFYTLIETIYRPIRSIIPTMMGGVDFTPMIALVVLYFADSILVSALFSFGQGWAR